MTYIFIIDGCCMPQRAFKSRRKAADYVRTWTENEFGGVECPSQALVVFKRQLGAWLEDWLEDSLAFPKPFSKDLGDIGCTLQIVPVYFEE